MTNVRTHKEVSEAVLQLTVNGEDRSLPAGSSVSDLVSALDLDGRMADAVVMLQLVRNLAEEGVARMALRHDEMRRQRGLGRAHRPDMEVVDGVHTR